MSLEDDGFELSDTLLEELVFGGQCERLRSRIHRRVLPTALVLLIAPDAELAGQCTTALLLVKKGSAVSCNQCQDSLSCGACIRCSLTQRVVVSV